jgi:hypothetical protein
MFTLEERRFFAATARGASNLSSCPIKQGAVLVRGHKILSTGHNRRIIPSSDKWESSAIFDAVFSARDVDLTGSALFTTYYPNVEDMKLLITAGIVILSFFGEVNDISSRDLSNSLAPASIPLEIIQLQ